LTIKNSPASQQRMGTCLTIHQTRKQQSIITSTTIPTSFKIYRYEKQWDHDFDHGKRETWYVTEDQTFTNRNEAEAYIKQHEILDSRRLIISPIYNL
jgi:ribosomal protein S17E